MNRSDLVRHVAGETGMTRSAAEVAVNSMLSGIAGSLARGEAVSPAGFGTFGTRSRPARVGRNPRTGESLEIAASTVVTFKPGRSLRASVNDGGTWIGFGNDRRQSGTGMPMMLNPAAFGMKTAGSPRLSTRRKEPSGDKRFGPAKNTSRHQPDRTGRNMFLNRTCTNNNQLVKGIIIHDLRI